MPMLAALLACIIGAALGLRFKFTVLFPATVVVVLLAMITGVGAPPARIVLAVILAMFTLQLGFLGGSAAHYYWLFGRHLDTVRADKSSRESPRPAQGPVA